MSPKERDTTEIAQDGEGAVIIAPRRPTPCVTAYSAVSQTDRLQADNLPLFRDEALAALPRYGLATAPAVETGFRMGAGGARADAAAAFVAFAATFEFARKEQVRGYLTPADGWSRVTAKSFGVVRRRLANPGDDVAHRRCAAGNFSRRRRAAGAHGPGPDARGNPGSAQRRWMSESDLVAREYEQETSLLTHADEADRRELERLEEEIELTRIRARIARQRYLDRPASGRLRRTGAGRHDIALKTTCRSRLLVLSERRRTADRLHANPSLPMPPGWFNWRSTGTSTRRPSASKIHALAMEESRIRGEGAHRVLAPRDGTVVSVRVDAGDGVQPGQALSGYCSGRAACCRDGCSFRPQQWALSNPARKCACTWTPFPTNATAPSRAGEFDLRHSADPGRRHRWARTQAGAHYRVDVEFPNGFTLSPVRSSQALAPGNDGHGGPGPRLRHAGGLDHGTACKAPPGASDPASRKASRPCACPSFCRRTAPNAVWHVWRWLPATTATTPRCGNCAPGFECPCAARRCANYMTAASRLGLNCRAVRVELAELKQLRVPAILHWEFDHFVVLKSVNRRGFDHRRSRFGYATAQS